MAKSKTKEIINKKAKFEYQFLQEFEAGIMLVGTEVKSLRAGNGNLKDAYCHFKDGALLLKSMYIGEYTHGNINNHETRRDRKLLLKKPELRKLNRGVKEKGHTIVPYKVYFSERGFVKVQIVLAQGKKSYDKRSSIKDKDLKRDADRAMREK